jgi:ATP synthase protein I
MTTAQPRPRPQGAVLGPLAATAGLGLLMVGVAAVVTGAPGALGALIGAALVGVVFASGAVVVGLVSMLAPTASLLVALLTYALQVLAVALFYLAMSDSGALDGPVDERWLAAAVIAGTLGWTAAQLVAFVRARQPVYDTPAAAAQDGRGAGREASVR